MTKASHFYMKILNNSSLPHSRFTLCRRATCLAVFIYIGASPLSSKVELITALPGVIACDSHVHHARLPISV